MSVHQKPDPLVLETVLNRLGLQPGTRNRTIKSPLREGDDNASFTINLESGLWYDHAIQEGGTVYDLAKKLNISIPEKKIHKNNRAVHYEYRNAEGKVLFIVHREETPKGKRIWQSDSTGSNSPPKLDSRPLYKLPELLRSSDTVLVVEGEKCASVQVSGYFLTTWSGGAAAVEKTDWGPLKDRKVIIWPDADEAGLRAALAIKRFLPHVEILRIEGKPKGWDIADAVAEGIDPASFIASCPRITEPRKEEITEETRRVLEEIVKVLHRFVVLPDRAAEVIALYVLQTYLIDLADFAPMLIITSPEMRCGKTTLLSILEELVYRPRLFANVTPAAVYRLVEKESPTLLIDEVDSLLKQRNDSTEALRGILNAGHRRGSASKVIRAVKDTDEFREYSVFCPKIIAGIGRVPRTWVDRGIVIAMRRKAPHETVERFTLSLVGRELEALQGRIEKATTLLRTVLPNTPTNSFPEQLNDRSADNYELLFRISDTIGGGWESIIREAAVALSEEGEEESTGIELLRDIYFYSKEKAQEGPFTTEELLKHLNDLDDRPWGSYNSNRGLSARNLASLLKPYGIFSTTVSVNGAKKKGYKKESFADAFARYLPKALTEPEHKPTPTPSEGNGNGKNRYPLPDPLPSNSLQDKELTAVSNGGTDSGGEEKPKPWRWFVFDKFEPLPTDERI
jgi:hypothetical protein